MYSRYLHVVIYDSGTDHTHEHAICEIVVNFSTTVVLSGMVLTGVEYGCSPLYSSAVSLSNLKAFKSLLPFLHNILVSTALEYTVGTWGYSLTITDCGNLTDKC